MEFATCVTLSLLRCPRCIFMMSILAEADEKLDRFYEIKNQKYTIEKVEKWVVEICEKRSCRTCIVWE
jgi:hypothetical protein